MTFISILVSCTTYLNLNNPEIKKFKEDISSEFNSIANLKVKHSPASIEFTYYFRKDINEKEIFDIFYKTRDLVESKKFRDGYFKEKTIMKEQPNGTDVVIPNIYISFNINNDNKEEIRFCSLEKMKPSSKFEQSDKTQSLGWYYVDGKGHSKPVE